jgi:hypothetical protein
MSSRRVLQAPERRVGDRRRPASPCRFNIWDWLFGGYYAG